MMANFLYTLFSIPMHYNLKTQTQKNGHGRIPEKSPAGKNKSRRPHPEIVQDLQVRSGCLRLERGEPGQEEGLVL